MECWQASFAQGKTTERARTTRPPSSWLREGSRLREGFARGVGFWGGKRELARARAGPAMRGSVTMGREEAPAMTRSRQGLPTSNSNVSTNPNPKPEPEPEPDPLSRGRSERGQLGLSPKMWRRRARILERRIAPRSAELPRGARGSRQVPSPEMLALAVAPRSGFVPRDSRLLGRRNVVAGSDNRGHGRRRGPSRRACRVRQEPPGCPPGHGWPESASEKRPLARAEIVGTLGTEVDRRWSSRDAEFERAVVDALDPECREVVFVIITPKPQGKP